MAHATLAPWAEIVPDHGQMTADTLDGYDVVPGFTYALADLFA